MKSLWFLPQRAGILPYFLRMHSNRFHPSSLCSLFRCFNKSEHCKWMLWCPSTHRVKISFLSFSEATIAQLSCLLEDWWKTPYISFLLFPHLFRHKASVLKAFLPSLTLTPTLDLLVIKQVVIKLHSLLRYYWDSFYFPFFHFFYQSRGKEIKSLLWEQVGKLTVLNSPNVHLCL